MLVFPFRWFEGFPNVVTRAMIMAKPVVASRIGAVPEIVVDGLLFGMGCIEELVHQIATLHAEPAMGQQMGRAGRARACSKYSHDAVYGQLVSIYQKTLGHSVDSVRPYGHPPSIGLKS